MDQRGPSLIVVPDASSILDSILPDERSGRDTLDILQSSTVIAPMIWPSEVANSLLVAVRRQRIAREEATALLLTLAEYEIELVASGLIEITREIFPLAAQHNLTVYDAQYVHLARSKSAYLLTLDKQMRAAAKREGVALA